MGENNKQLEEDILNIINNDKFGKSVQMSLTKQNIVNEVIKNDLTSKVNFLVEINGTIVKLLIILSLMNFVNFCLLFYQG